MHHLLKHTKPRSFPTELTDMFSITMLIVIENYMHHLLKHTKPCSLPADLTDMFPVTMLIVITYLLNSICKYCFLMEMQRIFFEIGSEFLMTFR